jgi:hypothetical protein
VKLRHWLFAFGTIAGLVVCAQRANAQSIIREPMAHPHLEIEVHGTLAYDGWEHSAYGLGGGFRIGIPLIQAGPIRRINNSLALSLGADALFWPDYVFRDTRFGLQFHVDAQWNFYLAPRISVFAEVGFAPYLFFDNCNGGCSVFTPWFDFAAGVRIHFRVPVQYPALILRLGSSGFTVGISF